MASNRITASSFDFIAVTIAGQAAALDIIDALSAGSFDTIDDFIFNDDDESDDEFDDMMDEIDDNMDSINPPELVDGRRGRNTRGPKRNFDQEIAYKNLTRHYFSLTPVFDDKQFERYFRITKCHFEKIMQELPKISPFFRDSVDATGEKSIYPELKIIAALKHLCYGATFNHDSPDFEFSENMIRVATENFAKL